MRLRPAWILPAVTAVAVTAAIVLLLLWLVGAFHPKTRPGDVREVLPVAPRAATIVIEPVVVPVFESAVGTIEPVQRIEIGSRLLARVETVHIERAGQRVQKGEILVELESADLRAELEQTRASHRDAAADLAQAQRDLEQTRQLFEQKISAADRLEQDTTRVTRAQASLERLAEAITAAETNLGYATIRAPSGGIVIDKHVEAGNLARPGEVLVTMYDPDRLQLVASVREELAAKLAVDDSVRVRIDALDKTCEASIAQIVPEAERLSRAFEVKVTGPCPPGVYSGMFGRLLIPTGSRAELRVPSRAIRSVGQLDMVFVVLPDGRMLRRFVRTGSRAGDAVEVLSGLVEGETILADATGVQQR